MKTIRHPTATTLVLAALRARDDFMSQRQLREALPGVTANQISAALYSLRKYRAIDVVVEPDGEGWWYALPEVDDKRVRVVPEIKDGIRRNRKPKAKGTAK